MTVGLNNARPDNYPWFLGNAVLLPNLQFLIALISLAGQR
jgi:hypothetical protein